MVQSVKLSKKANAYVLNQVLKVEPKAPKTITYDQAFDILMEHWGLEATIETKRTNITLVKIFREDEVVKTYEYPNIFRDGTWDWDLLFRDTLEDIIKKKVWKPVKKTRKKKEEPVVEVKPKEPVKKQLKKSQAGMVTVTDLSNAFKKQFGSILYIYKGRSKVTDGVLLEEVGLTGEISLVFDGNQTVGDFNKMMKGVGLTTKVYTFDGWVACLDKMPLHMTGKVKKSATKLDMERMLK